MAEQRKVHKKRNRVNPIIRWSESFTLGLINKVVECVKDSPESFEKPTAQRFYKRLAHGCTKLQGIPWACMRDKMRHCKRSYIAANTWKPQTGDDLMTDDEEKSVVDFLKKLCPQYEELHQIFGKRKNINPGIVISDNKTRQSPITTPLPVFSPEEVSEFSCDTDRRLSVSCEDANQTPEELPGTSADEICSLKSEQNTTKRNRVNKYVQYLCDICGQGFSHKPNFDAHINRHLGLLPFECKLCPQKFNAEANLKRHMYKHSGTFLFTCRFCGRKFLDSSERTRCERICNNDRPFKCRFCEKDFFAKSKLDNHLLTHTGERPFSCKICERTFSQKKHLVTHFKSTFHKQNLEKSKLNVAC